MTASTNGPEQSAADNYRRVSERVANAAVRAGRSPSDVRIVCVSKTVDLARIRDAYSGGARIFGENRVQEAEDKIDAWRDLPDRPVAEWHLIGHLQTNKARSVARTFDCVHSVDSVRLARELGKRAEEAGRQMPVLLEVNIARVDSKTGFEPDAVEAALSEIVEVAAIEVRGLMTIAPIDASGDLARPWFARLRELRDTVRSRVGAIELPELSMGMSNDYEAAIAEGATMVRIGRAIFGERAQKT